MTDTGAAQDPQVLLRRLPEEERAYFLAQYRKLASAAVESGTGYAALQRFLGVWSIRARARRPSGDEVTARIREIRDGAPTVPVEDFIAQHLGMSRVEAGAWWRRRVERAAGGR
ncbi:DUF6247 family protein [Actinomadura sp. WMMA1423]|uniref:DUF6247 family protein n=1 Tax=Actinomadura sp. WMMA1423 TaxID=2591108 RepID=UPI0011476E5F|nr:DUF6247 family protein [Actinomadura sp. WMMA1423]